MHEKPPPPAPQKVYKLTQHLHFDRDVQNLKEAVLTGVITMGTKGPT
jgi:hypothetical protein